MNIIKIFFLLILFFTASCTSKKSLELHKINSFQEASLRESLNHWVVQGSIVGQKKSKAFSIQLRWTQCGDDFNIQFFGPLHISLVKIKKEADKITLEQDGKKIYFLSEEELFSSLKQLPIPLADFKNWLKGSQIKNAQNSIKAGLIKQSLQGDWVISYKKYQWVEENDVPTIRLPALIEFSNPAKEIRGKMLIYSWNLIPGELCQN